MKMHGAGGGPIWLELGRVHMEVEMWLAAWAGIRVGKVSQHVSVILKAMYPISSKKYKCPRPACIQPNQPREIHGFKSSHFPISFIMKLEGSRINLPVSVC